MKIHLTFPGGLEFDFERKPMDKDRFEVLTGRITIIICVFMVGSGFLKLAALVAGR